MVDLRAESYRSMRSGQKQEKVTVNTSTGSATISYSGGGSRTVNSSGQTTSVTEATPAPETPIFSEAALYADRTSYEQQQSVNVIYDVNNKATGYENPFTQQSVLLPKSETVLPSDIARANREGQAALNLNPQERQPTVEQPSQAAPYRRPETSGISEYDLIMGNVVIDRYKRTGPLTQQQQQNIRTTAYAEEQAKRREAEQKFKEGLNPLQRSAYDLANSGKIEKFNEGVEYYGKAAIAGGMIATAVPLAPGFVGFLLTAPTAAEIARRGASRLDILGQETVDNRKDVFIDKEFLKQDIKKNDASVDQLMRNVRGSFGGSQLNEEIRYFNTEFKTQAEFAYSKYADEIGLTGSEKESFISQGVANELKLAPQRYYLDQGYTLEEARARASRIDAGVMEYETKDFKPFKWVPIDSVKNWGVKKGLQSINPNFIFKDTRNVVRQEAGKIAEAEGLQGVEYSKRVKTLEAAYYNRGYGQMAQDVAIELAGEFAGFGVLRSASKTLGSKGVQAVGKAGRLKVAATVAKSTAIGGIAEGGISAALSSKIYGEKPTAASIAKGAAFGAVTAGAFGGALGYFRAGKVLGVGKAQSLFGNVVQTGGYILDPYELPGDLTASSGRSLYTLTTGRQVTTGINLLGGKTPTLTFGNFVKTESIGAASDIEVTQGGTRRTILPQLQSPMNINIGSQSMAGVPSQVSTPATTSTPSQINTYDYIYGVPSNVPVSSTTTVSTTTSTTTPSQTIIETVIPSEVPPVVPVDTNTNTNTNVNVNIPTITPQYRFPLPAIFPPLLDLGGGSGSGGSGKGRKKKYIDELQLAFGILSDDKAMIKASKKGGSSKKKKKDSVINIFGPQEEKKKKKIRTLRDLIGF